MRKHLPSFLSGFLTAVLAVGMCASALAASGQLTYNAVSIALRGERRITAGTTIAAPNGQQVPSSILYTDEAGGKTHYLPIRAVSDLLGVDIGYDCADRTIHLDGRGAEARSGWTWKRELAGNHVTYEADAGGILDFDTPPAWRLTDLPEGFRLDSVHTSGGSTSEWSYTRGEDRLTFTCRYFSNAHVGMALDIEGDAARAWQAASVGGRAADFYQGEDRNLLVWENEAGMLCQLEGPLSRAELEAAAAGAAETTAKALPAYRLGWLPKGSDGGSRSTLREAVREGWKDEDGTAFSWLYAAADVGPLAEPAGRAERVRVNGMDASYWPGDPDAGGGVTVTIGSTREVTTIPGEGEMSVLLWTDPETGVSFRIQGMLDRETLVRMAESVQ